MSLHRSPCRRPWTVLSPGQVGQRLRRISTVLVMAVTAVMATGGRQPAALAQFDLAVERDLLESLFLQGRYRQALDEARRIETVVQPRKGQRGGQPSPLLIELLVYRGAVERRMGNLDRAQSLLDDAAKQFTSKEVQRAIALGVPRGDDAKEVRRYWLPINEMYFRMLDFQTELVLERIRSVNHLFAVKADPAPEKAAVEELFGRLDGLVRTSVAARSSAYGGVGDEDDDPSAKSPHARVMFSQARPQRYAGMGYLEASRLPWTLAADRAATDGEGSEAEGGAVASSAPEPDRPQMAESQRRRALRYLEKADRLTTAAIDAALVRFKEGELESNAYVTARKEAAIARADGLIALGEALTAERRFDDARASFSRGLALISEGVAERHPLLALPSMLSAQNALEQATVEFQAGDAVNAQRHAKEAGEGLALAKELIESRDSQYDPASPLHTLLADLIKASQTQETRSADLVAARDAADAAARRALQALARGAARRSAPAAAPAQNQAAP